MLNFSEIARVVRFHRKKSGLTQLELANLAGVGKTVVYDLEKGKETIRVSTLFKILEALNIRTKLESPLMGLYREMSDEGS
jgi:y4mF family transcriptional regulator